MYKEINGYYCGCFIVIIILLMWSWTCWRSHSDYLYGFWTDDGGDFSETSDTDTILLFIGHPDNYGCRIGYLVITPDICNQGIEMQLSGSWWGFSDVYTWRARISADDVPIWPEYINMIVSKADGTLRVVDDEGTLYASLIKQNDITNTARIATENIADD